MTWRSALLVDGPVDYVEFLDATWQDQPRWGDDPWVALDAPSLLYPGPPFPGFLLRVSVPAHEQLRLTIDSGPHTATTLVMSTELIVGSHGFWIGLGARSSKADLPSGSYETQVWVDPIAPGSTRDVAIVLGDRKPRRLAERHDG